MRLPTAAALLGMHLLVVSGCGGPRPEAQSSPSVAIELLRGVRWAYPHEGFDPSLPGYHLAGGIGRIRLAAQEPPGEFALSIRTTIALRPTLEGFRMEWGDTALQLSPFAEGAEAELLIETGGSRPLRSTVDQAYFEFSRGEDEVRVRFLEPALRRLSPGVILSWVDWYRR